MTKRRVIIYVLIASVVVALTVKIHRVREVTTGAELFWHDDEAYLLIGTKRLGLHVTPAKFVLQMLMLAPFGLGADDSKFSITVFKMAPTRVDRYVAENVVMGRFGVIDGRINDGLWRWDGDHFERATLDESIAHPRLGREYSDVDGWSKRSFGGGTSPPEGWIIPFDLSGQPASLTVHAVHRVSLSIDLQRGNEPPERLWSIDERSRTVRRAEYDALLKR